LGAEAKLFVHSLVVGTGNKRHTNLKADGSCVGGRIAFTKSLTADTVSAAGPLFKDSGIPREVIMHNMTAVAMKIYSLLSDLGADQDFGEQGRVKAVEDAVSCRNHVPSATFDQRDELLIAKAGCLIKGTPGGTGVRNIAAGGLKVFKEDGNAVSHAFMLVGEIGEK